MLMVLKYIALIGTFFIYTTSGVFSKLASQRNDELATAKVVKFDHFFVRLHLLRPGSLSIGYKKMRRTPINLSNNLWGQYRRHPHA